MQIELFLKQYLFPLLLSSSVIFIFTAMIYILLSQQKSKLLNKLFLREFFDNHTLQFSTRYYIEHNCSSVDPCYESEIRNLLVTEEKVFQCIDKFIDEGNYNVKYLLLLADSGMGKTTFLLNYFVRNQKLVRKKKKKIEIIPLGIRNPDKYIDKIVDKKDTILFLDAFDEDIKAIKDHRKRIAELMDKCSDFNKLLITCRTQFFTNDEEIPKESGIIKVGPRRIGEKRIYIFHKLYLCPLNDDQIIKYLKKYYRWNTNKRKKAFNLVTQIPYLAVRPMLLTYIPDLVNIETDDIKYAYQIYEIMIQSWIERETLWVNSTDLLKFSEMLAYDLYINREKRGAEKIPASEISALAKKWEISLENWQLTGRSLLNRDAEGNYKFAHRSIMEFLFIKKYIKMNTSEKPIIQLTDNMQYFADEIKRHNNC